MEKRVFIASRFTENMLSKKAKSLGCVISTSQSSFDELRNEPNLISALKNQSLVNTLCKKYGVKVQFSPIKFQLIPGDVLFTVAPSELIYELARLDEELPDHVTLTVSKYEVLKKEDFINF